MASSEQGPSCPNGHVNPQGQAFCGTCGAQLTVPPAAPGPPTFVAAKPTLPPPAQAPRQSNRTLAIGLLVGVGALAAAGAFALNQNAGSDADQASSGTAATARPAETTSTTEATTTTTEVPSHTLTGELALIQAQTRKTVEDGGNVTVDNPVCSGQGGYDDLRIGTSVTVRNQAGVIVATGAVDAAEFFDLTDSYSEGMAAIPPRDYGYGITDDGYPGFPGSTTTSGSCRLRFAVTDIPDEDFYTVELGHRGEVSYSAAQLEEQDWHVTLSLS